MLFQFDWWRDPGQNIIGCHKCSSEVPTYPFEFYPHEDRHEGEPPRKHLCELCCECTTTAPMVEDIARMLHVGRKYPEAGERHYTPQEWD